MRFSLCLSLAVLSPALGRPQAPEHGEIESELDMVEALRENAGIDLPGLPGWTQAPSLLGRSDSRACEVACTYLSWIYGPSRLLQQGTQSYADYEKTYWSNQQAEVSPRCVFKPDNAAAVSGLILLARHTGCQFAVRSGGHVPFRGASNIEGGITVSMENFNQVDVAADRKTVAVGPGNIWSDVYARLEAEDVVVLGGRLGSVGVGGLSLGGGISFFANLYGWLCDNIASYEIVLANGRQVTASASDHEDLYWALRGGGGNFGIVTSFHMNAFPLPGGRMFGGTRVVPEAGLDAAVSAFTELSDKAREDLNAGTWLAFVYSNGTKFAAAETYYANPNGGNASIFAGYRNLPSIADTTQVRTVASYAAGNSKGAPNGKRQEFWVLTMKNDEGLNKAAKDIYYDEVQALSASVPGVFCATTLQSISVPQMEHMTANGGNPIGLDPAGGALTLVLVNPSWADAKDDDAVTEFASKTLKRIKQEAVDRGLESDYLYLNYASQYQDVFASYGRESRERLQAVANKYDPAAVFQTLAPGSIKLDRAAVPGTDFFNF